MTPSGTGRATALVTLLQAQEATCPDALLFGEVAESVANAVDAEERAGLYELLMDFRHWDAIVDLHEDRLPLQRPRMVSTWQQVRDSAGIAFLRRWCIRASDSAASLHRMHWWLESVVALFEIRLRWGIRGTDRA